MGKTRTYTSEEYKVNRIGFYCQVHDYGILIQSEDVFLPNDSRYGWNKLFKRTYYDDKQKSLEDYFFDKEHFKTMTRYVIDDISSKGIFGARLGQQFIAVVKKDQYRTEDKTASIPYIPKSSNIEQPPSSKFSLTEIIRWLFSSCLPWFNK
jgi:hypothetical protein